ncbi:PAN domain-containing protein [Hyphomonas johnsonii]|uniref:Apple domain-containing protein n=1 Tax=Hyphomonas johnsonii MHS-2 TaxID=1280950 RepID=A0A059FSS0_9PROT|nr:PAN domain-containing protein [Hyphomonas johnsonii]KCZ93745.1 hypothetical protein HJO_00175 [Hyphomonas johnsonii MHS-2]
MRHTWMLAIAACFAAPALADAPTLKADAVAAKPVGYEQGLYRFGATYSVTDLDSALSCQTACADDEVCKAWSFIDAAGDSDARCELKRSGGRLERNPTATSGISPRHEALFSPEPTTPADELLGAEAGTDAGDIKAITVEIEKVDIDGPTALVPTDN